MSVKPSELIRVFLPQNFFFFFPHEKGLEFSTNLTGLLVFVNKRNFKFNLVIYCTEIDSNRVMDQPLWLILPIKLLFLILSNSKLNPKFLQDASSLIERIRRRQYLPTCLPTELPKIDQLVLNLSLCTIELFVKVCQLHWTLWILSSDE